MRRSFSCALLLGSLVTTPLWADDGPGQKITAPDAEFSAQFGYAVDVEGPWAVIGAVGATDAGRSSGSVDVYDTRTWQPVNTLVPSNYHVDQFFGGAVAISGTTALVGAQGDNTLGFLAGAAYLFDLVTGTEIAKLLPSDGAPGDTFGFSVALDGNLAVVGAPSSNGVGFQSSGSAYVFDVSTGRQLSKLTAADAAAWDRFGERVAVEARTVVVGAPYEEDPGLTDTGAAYVFDGVSGAQFQKLTSPTGDDGGQFGAALSIRDRQIAIGSPWSGPEKDGAVFVFDLRSNRFVLQLFGNDHSPLRITFGASLSMTAEHLAVGAPQSDVDRGQVELFDRASGDPIDTFVADGGQERDYFGFAVALSEENLLCGVPRDSQAAAEAGAVFRFGTRWSDLGFGLSGSAGVPSLIGSGSLREGSIASVDLSSAAPRAVFFLVIGLSQSPVSFAGGTLVPSPDFIFVSTTDASGAAQFQTLFPPGVLPCTAFYSQCWIVDPVGVQGFAASNALVGVTSPF